MIGRHLTIALLIQLATAFSEMTVPVLGPVITAQAGVAPETIGYFSSVFAAGTMLYMVLAADATARVGAVRLLQLGALLSAVALVCVTLSLWPAILFAALLLGLGNGPNGPASSYLLARGVRSERQGLAFSIKQSGVPIGAFLAGLIMPSLALLLGWQMALLGVAAVTAITAVVVQPFRSDLDQECSSRRRADPTGTLAPQRLRSPIATLRENPGLLGLAYCGSALAVVQGCVFAFFVTYLVDRHDLSLTLAGTAFALFQAASVAGRVLAGWVADRIGSMRRVLLSLALLGALGVLGLAAITTAWSQAAIFAMALATGLVICSWNGLLLAGVALTVPQQRVGAATSAILFFVFLGFVVGPAGFAVCVELWGYEPAFIILALISSSALFPLVLRR